jgi:hypothetical protein
MRQAIRTAGILSAALLGGLAAGGPARADVIRLENGRAMHGTVDRGFVDEDALRIQLFSTGGTVKVRWEHLIPEDREQWQVDLGLKESEESRELRIEAWKILFVSGTQEVVGLILNPEALDGPATGDVHVMVRGRELKYPKGQIAKTEKVMVDISLVFTPQQAYQRKLEEIAPNNGPGHFDLAEYARAVGAYDEAKEQYLDAVGDEIWKDTAQGRLVASRLATLEVLLQNRSLQNDLDHVKNLLIEARNTREFARAARAFLQAREEIFRISTDVKDAKVQKEFRIPELAQRVEVERRKFFESRLPLEMYTRVRKFMYDKAKEQKVRDFAPGLSPQEKAALMLKGTFEGCRQYATRGITEDLWNSILKDVGATDWLEELKALGEKDPARVTEAERARGQRLSVMEKTLKQELLDFWAHRSRNTFMVTNYGYGTFIVTGSTLKLTRKPPSANTGGNKGGNRKSGAAAPQAAVDVVKTPDTWWDEAGTKERSDWLLSWYAERGGLFEAFRTWEDNCDSCGGLGYKKISVAATGEEEAERCKTCNGAKVMKKVKWR